MDSCWCGNVIKFIINIISIMDVEGVSDENVTKKEKK